MCLEISLASLYIIADYPIGLQIWQILSHNTAVKVAWGRTFHGQCNYWQLSCSANVLLGKSLLGKRLMGRFPSGQTSYGQTSYGQLSFWANVCGEMSSGQMSSGLTSYHHCKLICDKEIGSRVQRDQNGLFGYEEFPWKTCFFTSLDILNE
jgi:hypothetical protein